MSDGSLLHIMEPSVISACAYLGFCPGTKTLYRSFGSDHSERNPYLSVIPFLRTLHSESTVLIWPLKISNFGWAGSLPLCKKPARPPSLGTGAVVRKLKRESMNSKLYIT